MQLIALTYKVLFLDGGVVLLELTDLAASLPEIGDAFGWTNVAGGRMRGANLTQPASVNPILQHLALPAEPPPLARACAPPIDVFDQTPLFDLTAPPPVPEFELDQTLSW